MKILLTVLTALLMFSSQVHAKQKVTLLLDWFVNPDHAALIVAQQKGYFAAHDLEVEIIEPADPSMPPKLVAAGKADLAVDYQPQLQMQVAEGLPLVRVGTLVSTPLNSIVVLQSSGIQSIADLKGKKIAVQIGTTSMEEAQKIEGAEVKALNSSADTFMELKAGNVDAVINDLPVNDYYIVKTKATDVKRLDDKLTSEEYGFAMKKGNTELKQKVDAALKTLKENGEYDKIYEKWFGTKPAK